MTFFDNGVYDTLSLKWIAAIKMSIKLLTLSKSNVLFHKITKYEKLFLKSGPNAS